MKTHEAGRESSILKDMKLGRKTIEARLAKGKFLTFEVGDHVRLREDFYENGDIVKSIPDQGLSEILKIELYGSFREMLTQVGLDKVLPRVRSMDDAIKEIRQFYTQEQEETYGVMAIHFKLLR